MTNIVMTGATTGIGAAAAKQLLARPGVRLITGARSGNGPSGAEVLPLDLASLASVRRFAGAVETALGDGGIDALVLNAGGQRVDTEARTIDGFESCFATNHLGHYLLARLLLPRLSERARIVITSSGTHDPAEGAEKFGVPPPRHADCGLLADPDRDPDRDPQPLKAAMRAYGSSKLCNLLTARSLAALPEATHHHWTALAYDPGLTPGTGLARQRSWAIRNIAWPLLGLAVRFSNDMNHLGDAGGGLAALATTAQPPTGRVYAALRNGVLTWPDPSELARDDAVMQRLWADSAALVGLP